MGVDDQRMPNDCPKCGYARQPADTAPGTECPRCGVIFAKYYEALAKNPALADRRPTMPPPVSLPIPRAPAPAPAPQSAIPTLARGVSAAAEALSSEREKRAQAEALADRKICKACGTAHAPKLPGSGWIEAALWIVIPFWPAAVIYSIWRRVGQRKCAACGSSELVGVTTPVGQGLVRLHYSEGLPPLPPPPPPPRVGKMIVWTVGAFMVFTIAVGLLARA